MVCRRQSNVPVDLNEAVEIDSTCTLHSGISGWLTGLQSAGGLLNDGWWCSNPEQSRPAPLGAVSNLVHVTTYSSLASSSSRIASKSIDCSHQRIVAGVPRCLSSSITSSKIGLVATYSVEFLSNTQCKKQRIVTSFFFNLIKIDFFVQNIITSALHI